MALLQNIYARNERLGN